jgi:hypothetical protein
MRPRTLTQMLQIRRILVIDKNECCVGIVSQADLVRRELPDRVHRTNAEISKPLRNISVLPIAG